jgi:nucleoside-diphosphate-sugar epimerase
MRTTVLGATGGIGRAIVTELAARGHEVTAASRSVDASSWPTGVRVLHTDLRDPASADAACRGADVVVMAAQVPYTGWATELGPLFDAAVEAASRAEARLVLVDNLYAYGSPGTPITEATPEAATTVKGGLRRELTARVLAAGDAGRLPGVSAGRFSDYYGPDGENSLVQQVGVSRALAGKKPQAFIAADQPHTFHYLPDAARGFATLVERPDADGRVWILPGAPAVTQRELYRQLGEVLGRNLGLATITRPMLWAAGLVDKQLKEAREVVAQFDRPYVTDASDFETLLGRIEVTPHRDALAATVAATRGAAEVAA